MRKTNTGYRHLDICQNQQAKLRPSIWRAQPNAGKFSVGLNIDMVFSFYDRRQFHNITVAEFHRSHTIPPLFLSTLGALIVGVAGSLNSLVSCYRGLPCPAEARPVLVLYHGASDAANGGAEWMRTSLWLLYPLGAFLWTLRALRTLWVWCCGAAACALG